MGSSSRAAPAESPDSQKIVARRYSSRRSMDPLPPRRTEGQEPEAPTLAQLRPDGEWSHHPRILTIHHLPQPSRPTMSLVGEHLAYPASMEQPRHGHGRVVLAALLTAAVCVGLTGGARPGPVPNPPPAFAGVRALRAPPAGTSWAPRPVTTEGLTSVATAG